MNHITIEDIAYKMDNDNAIIYLGNNVQMDDEVTSAVMLVTHEFTYTGAPIMLLEVAKSMKNNGLSVWTLCKQEGSFAKEFVEAGINVIIYPNFEADHLWLNNAQEIFSLWFLNTLILFSLFKKLNAANQKTIWWIHENEYIFSYLAPVIKKISLNPSSQIVAAGPYVQSLIKKHMQLPADILNFPVDDMGTSTRTRDNSEKIKILQVGYLSRLKGQTILLDAFELLSDKTKEIVDITFCANSYPSDEEVLQRIEETVSNHSNIHLIPAMEKEALYELYNDFDIIIVASKKEATSAIMVEAMMKGIIGICSDACGITYYIKDNESGFIFKSEDPNSLSQKIEYIIEQLDQLEHVKRNARKIYEENFSKEIFENKLFELL